MSNQLALAKGNNHPYIIPVYIVWGPTDRFKRFILDSDYPCTLHKDRIEIYNYPMCSYDGVVGIADCKSF